jgi:cell division protein FtsB
MTRDELLAHLRAAHADTPAAKAALKALTARHRELHAEGDDLADGQRAAAHQHIHASL